MYDIIWIFFTKTNEKSTMKSKTTLIVTPPQEADNDLSEEDNTDEDCTDFDLVTPPQKADNDLSEKNSTDEDCTDFAEAEAYRQGAILQVNRK